MIGKRKIAQLKEETPRASIGALMASLLTQESKVDGRTVLAGMTPKEAPKEIPARTGSSFLDSLMAGEG